jgi:hypothetical protein
MKGNQLSLGPPPPFPGMNITFIVIAFCGLKNSLAYQIEQIDALQKDGQCIENRINYVRRITH